MTDPTPPTMGRLARAAAIATAMLAAAPAAAQGFSAYASPSRFELVGKPGATQRQVLEIQHVGREQARFRIYTNDWEMKDDLSLDFSDALKPGSCRPWVALERRELTVPPNGKHRFRFEVTPPADAPAGECRFAIMIEGADPARVNDPRFTFPVSGRIGVIVYVRVGEAAARMVIGAGRVAERDKERLPLVEVRNEGNAHGRLEGFLSARDAQGREFEMYPEDVPVLPGRRREVALRELVEDGKTPPPLQFPLAVKGNLEWGGQRVPFEMRFAP